ncbi:hypothetical protein OIU84_012779 [Salix udensis]|uniref:2'-phosphotransferase n=1 Tax=Salix udensis TaxID=889485 RepID=A0AAD6JGM0_9ROSI|nr:hypothetical protein OIU84_012779 [Salix udensis]
MWASHSGIRILGRCRIYLATSSTIHKRSPSFALAASIKNNTNSNMSSPFSHSSRGGRGLEMQNDRERSRGRGRGGGGSSMDRIDALGRLLTRILHHILLMMLKRLLEKIIKQRFSLLEEGEELLIRANQGHTIKTVESENLLKAILSPDEITVCVHGTYKKNLDSILESGLKRMQRLHVHFSSGLPTDGQVISGMRRDVNVLIFLDVRKALEEGMKLYISDNRVILTEGFDGVIPVKYFERIESWPDRRSIPFQTT